MEPIDIHPQLARASTLSSKYYLDPAFLEVERHRIFRPTWQSVGEFVGEGESLRAEGSYFTFELSGEPLVAVRQADESWKGFINVCRHRASPVARGKGRCRVLVCPYHAWTYGLDGRLIGQPDFDSVENWDRSQVSLPLIDLKEWGPLLFAKVDAGGPSFEDWVADIPKEIDAAGFSLSQYRFLIRKEYEVQCNWKVYVDNYLESYHIPNVHPALYRELDFKNYRVDTFRYYSSQYSPLKTSGAMAASATQAGVQKPGALYYWLFPNIMLNIYPEQMHTSVVYPISVDKTLVVFDWYLPREQRQSASIDELTAFNDQVQKEDMVICESVQKGLRSPSYDSGRLSVRRENGVHHFHRLIQEFTRDV